MDTQPTDQPTGAPPAPAEPAPPSTEQKILDALDASFTIAEAILGTIPDAHALYKVSAELLSAIKHWRAASQLPETKAALEQFRFTAQW